MEDNQAPVEEDAAPAYSVYEVAQIAAKLLTDGGQALSENGSYLEAAVAAVALLDACQDELRWQAYVRNCRRESTRQKGALSRLRAGLTQKYQDGKVPWLNGLLKITGTSSEADATPLFRSWREFETIARKSRAGMENGEVVLNPGVVETESGTATYKKNGFSVDEVAYFKLRYAQWIKRHHIPSSRSAAGKKSGEVRRNRSLGS